MTLRTILGALLLNVPLIIASAAIQIALWLSLGVALYLVIDKTFGG